MKCPKCGKDVELQKRQVGLDDNGEPILNEFAICRDCKKKWNLDKQRQKKEAETKTKAQAAAVKPAQPEKKAPAETAKPAQSEKKPSAEAAKSAAKPAPSEKKASAETPKPARAKRDDAPKRRTPSSGQERPVKTSKRTSEKAEQRYGNVPPENVRRKRENTVKKNYEDMLATDPGKDRPRKKKRPASAPERPAERPQSKRKPAKQIVQQEEPKPRFKPLRILLGIIGIIGAAFFGFRAVMAGLDGIATAGQVTTGMVYVVLALCILVSGLISLIMQNRLTRLAFILPFLFCAGSAVFTFLKRGDDKWLLYGMIFSAALAVIYLLLAILAGGGDDDYDDYEDPFDDDYEDY